MGRRAAAYVVVVAVLAAAAVLGDGPVGYFLYLTAWALTLPTGVLIYPALWVIQILATALGGDGTASALAGVGLVVSFGAAAVGNALLGRALWARLRR